MSFGRNVLPPVLAHEEADALFAERAAQPDRERVLAGRDLAHALGGGDAIEGRHVDVHQDDIGLELRGQLQSGFSAFGLAYDRHVGLDPEPDADGLAHHGMVVYKK